MDGLNRESGQIGFHSEDADVIPDQRHEQSLWGSRSVLPVSIDPYLQKTHPMDSGCESSREDSVIQGAIVDKRTERFLSPRDEAGQKTKNRKKRKHIPSKTKSESLELRNKKHENSSRTAPFSSYQLIFSTMNSADCQAHLDIIIAIEQVLIDALHSARSIKNADGHRSRYLNLEQHRKLHQYLTDWQQLAPAGASLSIRNQLEKALNENDLGQLRQLFPIHESGSLPRAGGQNHGVSHYKGLRSKQVASVLDILKDMNR
ncbi:hypothetical protein [Endozoicomonas sp. SCSIO W0465]|uniref:hypothetical protein n=1 Tax=Endozoicomonas sp. SCSIO W0465 TaxID=2918516 RepID=UPI0020751022|nr:hypothetical protein [Endozoicomonas sp. SCSIO W0465]USE38362.1 hypothetical protein MJO57_09445 [Endozoicomonas sp. SCSIO W0465]